MNLIEPDKINERLTMVAPCGIDCGICELHLVSETDELYRSLLATSKFSTFA